MKSINLIDIDQIISLQKDVSEEINDSNLFKFFKTIILENDITFDKDTVVFYTFIERLKRYNIFVLQDQKQHNISIIPHIFSTHYINHKTKNIDLYVTDRFFALYCSGQLQCFKTLEGSDEVSSIDIENYISSFIDIKIDNIYNIDNYQFKSIKEEYINHYTKIKQLKSPKEKLNKWLPIVAVVALFMAFTYYYNDTNNATKQIETKKVEKIILPTITSIIDNSILIDGIWYDEKQKYDTYIIEDVDLSEVTLIKNEVRHIIRINGE